MTPPQRSSRRATAITASALAVATLMLGGSCGTAASTTVDSLDLNRPIDVAFACYGGLRIPSPGGAKPTDPVIISSQPIESCRIRSQSYPTGGTPPVPTGQEDLASMGGQLLGAVSYYAFILQSANGSVALATFATKPSSAFAGGDITLIDADPLSPGKNSISVGENPVAIATDRDGCFEVVANAGSCDLALLDINSALDADPAVRVDRLAVTNAAGQPIGARPAAMVGQPGGGTIGAACAANATGLAYVAYPGCHLVAAVDVSTGKIVAGVSYDASGVPTITDGNVTCPDECAGGLPTAGVRPTSLDLKVDPRNGGTRLLIGADNAASLTLVNLGADATPQSLQRIPLWDPTGTLGVTAVAISPQVGMGGSAGVINDDTATGGQFQFVYAVTTDSTVRVADILNVNKECDTQVDARYLTTIRSVKTLSCMPVGDPATPPRRPGVRGPGLELPNKGVPLSVQTFRADTYQGDLRADGPLRVIGYFGVITASNGGAYVFNIDDDNYGDLYDPAAPLNAMPPLAIAHQLRDAVPGRDLLATTTSSDNKISYICNTAGPDPDAASGNTGGPRSSAEPQRGIAAGLFAIEKVAALPGVRQVQCTGSDTTKPVSELTFAAPVSVRDLEFPDLRGLSRDETITLTWQGPLSRDTLDVAVDGPATRAGSIFVDALGMTMADPEKPYCAAGVEPYDIVQLRGCDPNLGNNDCPVGFVCFVHPQSQVGFGSCLKADEADRLSNACRGFLVSDRTYTVSKAESGVLHLLPRKHKLMQTPLDGCTSNQQCQDLATYALKNTNANHPVNDTTKADTHTWSCEVDPDRRPGPAACLETCTKDADCLSGTVCDHGYCMEGVTPPQACVPGPQKYNLLAGDAFTVVGSRTGYVHDVIADATHACVHNPAASPLLRGRIPLTAPACTGDGRTDLLPNPCATTVDQVENQPQYVAGTCTPAATSTMMVTRKAQAIRFRNPGMTLTLVDPTYPGDAACIGDRGGTLVNVPTVFQGYQIAWRQTGGLSPLTLNILPALPVKVVHGPLDSIWVIDEGDYLSTSVSTASTRGKVFRLEAQALTTVNALQ